MQEIVGLDIETSGSKFATSRTLQIAIAFQDGTSLVRDIGGYWPAVSFPDTPAEPRYSSHQSIPAEPEAIKVNGWTHARYEASRSHEQIDLLLEDRLLHDRNVKPRSLVAVGWNVAGFDILFVNRDLPKVASFFHYRTVDLNACVFMLSGSSDTAYHDFKDRLKLEAQRLLEAEGIAPLFHDAGYDARHGLVCFNILRSKYGLPGGR